MAGLWGGVALVVLSPLLSWLSGISIWAPPKYRAAMVLGSRVLEQPGFQLTPVLVGALMLVAGAIVLGGVFGVVYRRVLRLTTDFGLPMYVGLVYGLLIFMIAYFGLLPIVDPTLVASSAGMAPVALQSMVYAMCLGLFYTLVQPAPYRYAAVLREL